MSKGAQFFLQINGKVKRDKLLSRSSNLMISFNSVQFSSVQFSVAANAHSNAAT